MTLGVIISTYNNPLWLEKTLWGYMAQTRQADEIIIADDGSTGETAALVRQYAKYLPLHHVWQEDKGFRKTRILNKAILTAKSEYLVFTDQDCIPRRDFLAAHEHYARRGRFLSGGYFKLPMDISLQIIDDDIASGMAFRLRWLRAHGLKWSIKCLKLIQNPLFSKIMNHLTPTRATWNGMNSSGWREDIISVNGFDERMQYGGEDREMGERLINSGIRPVQIRYSVIELHLDHARPYVNDEARRLNDFIRRETKKKQSTYTVFGIYKPR